MAGDVGALYNGLHDALIKNIQIDYATLCITINIEYYRTQEAAERTSGSLIFKGVESFSHTVDLTELQKHDFAGHVGYLKQTNDDRTFYLYLAAGCLVITADKVYLANT